jgi:hypothetical protein
MNFPRKAIGILWSFVTVFASNADLSASHFDNANYATFIYGSHVIRIFEIITS